MKGPSLPRRRSARSSGRGQAGLRLEIATAAGEPLLRLEPGESARVGRGADCELRLDVSSVSRLHARLEFADDGWRLVDAGSANGSTVNGEPVTSRELADGDALGFGHAEPLTLRLVALVPAPAAADATRVKAPRGRAARAPRLPRAGRGLFSRLPAMLQSLLLWRLQPLAGSGARRLVGRGHLIVGRAESADLRLDSPQVSGLHARLERRGGVLLLRDMDSANGTFHNGEQVAKARLVPGDRVSFADVEYRLGGSALPSARGWLLLGSLAALLVLGASGRLLLASREQGQRLWTRAMYEEQVESSLRAAVEAMDREPPTPAFAIAQFDIAIRSLVAADRLEDPADEAALAAALREAAARVGRSLGGRDIVLIYRNLHRPPPPPPPVPSAAELAASAAPAAPSPFVLVDELMLILAEFGIDPQEKPIPPEFLAEVQRFVAHWTGPERAFTERSLARARPHLGMIRRQLRAAQLPEVFCYLPFIESGYRNTAVSTAGAGGMWQFMPKTARQYGLRVDEVVDQRTDPEKLTGAACRYLNDLLSMFGANSFMCALASYNKGEYGMLNCLRGVNWRSSWKFWDIVEKGDGCLKQETIEYVPRFLAAAIVARHPEAFGLNVPAAEAALP
jgi:pSer/pThr/pTyr-binding forkhead associated (FHA) protein